MPIATADPDGRSKRVGFSRMTFDTADVKVPMRGRANALNDGKYIRYGALERG